MASSGLRELAIRTVSAVLLAAFVLFCTWAGGLTWLLLIVVSAVLIFAEFRAITAPSQPLRVTVFAAGFLLILFVAYLTGQPEIGMAVVGAGCVVLLAWEWFIRGSAWGTVGLVYAAAPFAAMVALRDGPRGLIIIIFLFAAVWGTDIFAYFTGRALGGPKLAPIISPKKTWSGFAGGLAGAIACSAAVLAISGIEIGMRPIVLAVYLALFSQTGDLFESWVKRTFGRKDSGRIIPGHGGFLDRVDGMIFAAAAFFLLGAYLSTEGLAGDDVSTALSRVFFRQ